MPDNLPLPDDSFDDDAPLDASQAAVHGLLAAYFELKSKGRASRADRIIPELVGERRRPTGRVQRVPQFTWWIGLAAAILLAIAFLRPWRPGDPGGNVAFADVLDNVLFAAPLPPFVSGIDPTDLAAIAQAEAAIRDARERMEEYRGVDDGPFMHAWMNLYRNLRSLGRWEEALAEIHAAYEFGRALDDRMREEGKGGWTYFHSLLTDLGYTYASLGDVERAWQYHTESLRLASEYLEWNFSPAGNKARESPLTVAITYANSLGVRHWALAALAESQGDLETARDHLDSAAKLFGDALAAVLSDEHVGRRSNGDASEPPTSVGADAQNRPSRNGQQPSPADMEQTQIPNVYPDGASPAELAELAIAIGETADGKLNPLLVHVRGHLLREAQWLRLSRRPDAAWDVLQMAQSIRYSAQADESRLDFNEPLEGLRMALARRDFDAALLCANTAEGRTHGLSFPDELNLPRAPINVFARAELRFLRAVAEAARNPTDPDAAARIEESIAAAKALADSLPLGLRERFLKQLTTWDEVLNH